MEINAYLQNIDQISGWCAPHLWQCIEAIQLLQKEKNINGPIAEIGVYQGKFFCGLALTKGAELEHCAMDVFNMQEFNLDGAGAGDIEMFKKNLDLCGIHNTEIHIVDSMSIEDAFINNRLNKYSFFSVDGCHTAEHTINDFKIAMKMVRKDGIIFIDDYNNPNWPNVQEGMSKFYFNQVSNFIPLLFMSNKLFICNLSYHRLYYNYIKAFVIKHYPTTRVKEVKRFGYDTLTVTPDYELKKYLI
jgi:hypothetical protein